VICSSSPASLSVSAYWAGVSVYTATPLPVCSTTSTCVLINVSPRRHVCIVMCILSGTLTSIRVYPKARIPVRLWIYSTLWTKWRAYPCTGIANGRSEGTLAIGEGGAATPIEDIVADATSSHVYEYTYRQAVSQLAARRGSTVWAPFGESGWRPAIVTGLGKTRGDQPWSISASGRSDPGRITPNNSTGASPSSRARTNRDNDRLAYRSTLNEKDDSKLLTAKGRAILFDAIQEGAVDVG